MTWYYYGTEYSAAAAAKKKEQHITDEVRENRCLSTAETYPDVTETDYKSGTSS
jgi:hypothetical protein